MALKGPRAMTDEPSELGVRSGYGLGRLAGLVVSFIGRPHFEHVYLCPAPAGASFRSFSVVLSHIAEYG